MRQVRDIETTRSDISRDHHTNFIRLEHAQRTFTSGLALVAMNRHCANALLIQMRSELISAMLGARKDQYLRPLPLLDHFG